MDKEQFYKALYNATGGTFRAPGITTCMGWIQSYDDQGRPLRTDPNYLHYIIRIDGVDYAVTKHEWMVYVWKPEVAREASYGWLWSQDIVDNKTLYIFDTTPDYVKEYYERKNNKCEYHFIRIIR